MNKSLYDTLLPELRAKIEDHRRAMFRAERVEPFEREYHWQFILRLMVERTSCGRTELLVWTHVPACDTTLANYVIALAAVMDHEDTGGLINDDYRRYREYVVEYLSGIPAADLGGGMSVDRDYSAGAPYHHWFPIGPHGRPITKHRWARAYGWRRWW